MLGWMNHKLESVAGKNINNLRYAGDTILKVENERELKSFLMRVIEKSEKAGLKLVKEYIKAECCHPAYLTSMQSTSCEMQGWMKHKLESAKPGEISTTLDMQMIPL